MSVDINYFIGMIAATLSLLSSIYVYDQLILNTKKKERWNKVRWKKILFIVFLSIVSLIVGLFVIKQINYQTHKTAIEKEMTDKKAAYKKAADKRAAYKKAADKRAADKKAADKKAADKKAADKKAADKKAADKKAADKKAADKIVEAMGMVRIPSGSFQMGDVSRSPSHRVNVESFLMSKYEITKAQWQEVMSGSNPSGAKRSDFPVGSVSWNDVERFINKLNKQTGLDFRLPSESEWEYASRAKRSSKYSWGKNKKSANLYAWYKENSNDQNHPVGEKQANGFGLYDMNGNVHEWVQDCWNESYKGSPPTNGSPWLSGQCGERMFRGGSHHDSIFALESAYRDHERIDKKYSNLGFRLAYGNMSNRLKVEASVGNVRKEPSTQGEIIARIHKGDYVTKLDENQKGWYQVKLESGVIAWAYRSIFQ